MSLKRKRTDNGAENIDIGSGTVSDPSIAFTDGSGFYSVSNGVVGVTCAGTRGLAIEASKSLFPSGSASAPSIVMGSDLTSGLYTPGSGSVGVTCSGTQVLKFGSNIQIPLSTASTSQSSGALVVTGGIGVGGNSTLGQTTFAPSGTTSGLISSSGYLGYAGLGATLYTVRLTAGITNATGDGTTYTLFQTSTATDSSTVRSGVSFNSSTGVFTISAAGTYLFIMLCSVGVLTSAMTNCHMNIVGSTYGSLSVSTSNPYACQSGSSSTFTMAASTVLTLVASETVYFACTISGSTKTASITGGRMTILQLA